MDYSAGIKEIQDNHANVLLEYVKKTHHSPTDKKYHVYFGTSCMESFVTKEEAIEYQENMKQNNLITIIVCWPAGPGKRINM